MSDFSASVVTVSMMEFWSYPWDTVTLTATPTDVILPAIDVYGIPFTTSTIKRVVGLIKCRAFDNTAAVENKLAFDCDVNILAPGGAWGVDNIPMIDLFANLWRTAASTKEGGMQIEGAIDVAAKITANTQYHFKIIAASTVANNLVLTDLMVGIKVYFVPT
jgi:hypothetical protein